MPSASRDPDELLARGWRPIETAPKDGTTILIYQPDPIDRFHIEPAVWYDGYPGWDNDRDYMGQLQPTHWMPLPEPPDAE